jgi:DNA polymerase (family 10)
MTFTIQKAKELSDEIVKRLEPYCQKIQVAGSIRREKPTVHDIDIVLIADDLECVCKELAGLGELRKDGQKIKCLEYKDVSVDLYFATPQTWATLLLIRTGSKENNIRLCARAKTLGMHLAASGDGLFDQESVRIAGDTEESIFQELGLPYKEPQYR